MASMRAPGAIDRPIDVDMKPLVFNFGVGRGLTEASDKWTVKAIIEVPLNGMAK